MTWFGLFLFSSCVFVLTLILLRQSKDSSFAFLQKALQAQVEACNLAATRYLHAGDKDTSLAFQKEKKQFLSDLDAIATIQASGGPLPKFHSESKTYSYINQLTDLQENEIELTFGKCVGIPIPAGYTSVDSYFNYTFPHPSEEAPQKGYCTVVRNTTDPDYNFSVKLSIERSKALTRFFEKKKLTLDLMHNKGFLRKDVELGCVNVELAYLLGHCEYHEMLDVLNEKRKPTGAKLEIIIRLRYPIASVEHVNVTEKWFYVDHFQTAPDPAPKEKSSKDKGDKGEKAEKAEKAAAKEAKAAAKATKEAAEEPKAAPKAAKEPAKEAPKEAPKPVAKPKEEPKAVPKPAAQPAAVKPAVAAAPAAADDDDDEDPDE